jgi:hypothetical protein
VVNEKMAGPGVGVVITLPTAHLHFEKAFALDRDVELSSRSFGASLCEIERNDGCAVVENSAAAGFEGGGVRPAQIGGNQTPGGVNSRHDVGSRRHRSIGGSPSDGATARPCAPAR